MYQQAWITHEYRWGVWPETSRRDWTEAHAERRHNRYGDLDLEIRFWDPYSAYGYEPLPRGHKQNEGRFINNVREDCRPSDAVQARMVEGLEALARDGVTSIWWDHAIQCFPSVAEHLPRLFPVRVLNFGDDMPGSSDIKTLPVARHFSALVHSMDVWDFASGRSVPDVYAEHGLHDCRFIPARPTLEGQLGDDWLEAKLQRIAAGSCDIGLVWIGAASGGWRGRLQRELADRAGDLEASGFRVVLHGSGMRDGRFEGEPRDLYAQSALGLNLQESSLFNQRLGDLWLSGTVQVLHDPHGELAQHGFRAGVHYLAFDGTVDDLLRVVRAAHADRPRLVGIARAARLRGAQFYAETSWHSVYARLWRDYLGARA